MQSQKKQQKGTSKCAKRKTKQNKWQAEEQSLSQSHKQQNIHPPQIYITTDPEKQVIKQYENISKLSQKYKFDINAVIGNGFASSVYLGQELATKKMVCIKAIDLLTLTTSGVDSLTLLQQQFDSMEQFRNSEYIVNLYDIYSSRSFYYVVMELCPAGDLYKMMKFSTFQLPVVFVNDIVKQIVHGLQEIHEKEMIHRDLKTENILIVKLPQSPEDKIKIKIGDLGFCITLEEIFKLEQLGKKALNLGSPIYMCPEIATNHKYSLKSDIYALGIIWYELLHKVAPWQAKTEKQLTYKKLNEPVKVWRADIPEHYKQIITKILDKVPENRPKLSEIMEILNSHTSQQ